MGSQMGKNLGRTTGWIRTARLRECGVQLIAGAQSEGREQRGLVMCVGQRERVLEIDDVVACIGQEPDLRFVQDCPIKAAHSTSWVELATPPVCPLCAPSAKAWPWAEPFDPPISQVSRWRWQTWAIRRRIQVGQGQDCMLALPGLLHQLTLRKGMRRWRSPAVTMRL
jgi:hypothetical protein